MADDADDDWLPKVYGARDQGELRQAYDAWADSYDDDLARYAYRHPALATGMVARHVQPGEGAILDAGAGTGLIGELLAVLGYAELVAIDLSDGMLAQAQAKGCYAELHRMVLGAPLTFTDDRFRAVVAVGVFTVGHAPATALDELVRITRPGGHVVFSVTEPSWRGDGFADAAEALASAGRWRRIDATAPYVALPAAPGESALSARVYVYEVA